MARIDIDIDDYLEEASTKVLINELESRGYDCLDRRKKTSCADEPLFPKGFGRTLMEEEALAHIRNILRRFTKGGAQEMLDGLSQLSEK